MKIAGNQVCPFYAEMVKLRRLSSSIIVMASEMMTLYERRYRSEVAGKR
jgi:hypothetical protein